MSRDTYTFGNNKPFVVLRADHQWAWPSWMTKSLVMFTWSLKGLWATGNSSPPVYTPGSAHRIHFSKWHLPIASRSVEIVSVCLFTWKLSLDNLSLCFYSLHTIPISKTRRSQTCPPPTPRPSTLIVSESLLWCAKFRCAIYLLRVWRQITAVPIHCGAPTIRPIVLQSRMRPLFLLVPLCPGVVAGEVISYENE